MVWRMLAEASLGAAVEAGGKPFPAEIGNKGTASGDTEMSAMTHDRLTDSLLVRFNREDNA